ncbi:MAG: tail fiber domain-containing protein, partial [Flavobacteriales bacterium]|nr:tail fiber domain-containing protein [Flavobacteriales bacterium]
MRYTVLLAALAAHVSLLAQTPEAFSYQAVARDANGDPLANTTVGVQFQLHQGFPSGTVVYAASYTPTTNDLGLFTVLVGYGTPTTGDFASIDWGVTPNYYLEVGLDTAGGTNYTSMGTQRLLSVPYALHAGTANDVNAAALFGAGNTPPASTCFGQVGNTSTGANPFSVARAGDHAYLVNYSSTSPNLTVFDVSDPTNPTQVASVTAGSGARSVAVEGNHAYVVNTFANTLMIFDVSDPTTPDLRSTTPTDPGPVVVSVVGSHAYSLHTNGTMGVFNVSDPDAPTSLPSVGVGNGPQDIAFANGHAFVVNSNSNDMMILDMSDPAAPAVVDTIPTEQSPRSIAISGNHAFVVNRNSFNITVYDITDPMALEHVATLPFSNGPEQIRISGNYAYVISSLPGVIHMVDITDPTTPAIVGTTSTGDYYRSITVSGNHAYVPHALADQMSVFELFCPNTQQQVLYDPVDGTFSSAEASQGTGWSVSGDTLFTLDRKVGIGISDPNSLLAGTDIGLVDDAGEHARITMKSNAVMGVLDARSTPGAERMQLGSVSAHPLSFFTTGSLRMTLDTDGLLGLGTTSPNHLLDLRADGQAFGHRSADSTIAIGTYVDNTFGAFLQTHTDHPLQFATNNGNAAMTLLQNGNFGIGASNPAAKLHVAGTKADLWLQDTDDGSILKVIAPDPTGASTGGVGTEGAFDLPFFTNNLDRMTIKADGNVGIGTTAPSRRLQIHDLSNTASIKPAVKIKTNNCGGPCGQPETTQALSLQNQNGTEDNVVGIGFADNDQDETPSAWIGARFIDKTQHLGDLVFYTRNQFGLSQRMTIQYDGDVGIGTDNPNADLSVNGTANNSTGSWGVFSDARIKTEQRLFTDGLNVIDRLRPIVFTYNADAPFEAEGEQVGIIAQELEALAPYMVSTTEHGDITDLREVNNQAYVF